ncbi:metalloproteinase inhibitor 3-like [Apostichopus japonicus]|uniref:metalloproteinase inhibitor 3-like n=1 Tax=Stichopus japonicus TaxID=307972 RepID=UPI003AB785C7
MPKAMWFSRVLSVVLVMSSIRNIQCCTCVLLHPQEVYCAADYVIRGRVTAGDVTFINYERDYQYQQSTTTLPPQIYLTAPPNAKKIVYTVDIEKSYKRNGLTAKGTTVEIVTDSIGLDCFVGLATNYSYVIMGDVINDQLTLGVCGYYRTVNQITKRQFKGLKRQYRKNCNECSICGRYDYCDKTKGICTLDFDHFYSRYCEIDFARCGKNKGGICDWLGGKDYRRCLRNH